MIVNNTKKKTLATEIEKANSFWKKTKGLMFRKTLEHDRAMLFTFDREDFTGIWMMFMRFPIDLVYLDSKKRVVTVHEKIRAVSFNPKTWRVYYPDAPAKYIIELPAGTIKKTKTEAGDLLEF